MVDSRPALEPDFRPPVIREQTRQRRKKRSGAIETLGTHQNGSDEADRAEQRLGVPAAVAVLGAGSSNRPCPSGLRAGPETPPHRDKSTIYLTLF